MTGVLRLFIILVLVHAGAAWAEDPPAAAATKPAAVEAVMADLAAREDPGTGLVFVELFSAERCPFCPQAERNMKDLLDSPDVLGMTCIVDYFDAGTDGPLSQPRCTAQQDLYISKLKAGSRYTPQIVVNGRVQMTGYHMQKTIDAIRAERAAGHTLQPLNIEAAQETGSYDVVLPQVSTPIPETATDKDSEERYVLRVIMIRRTPKLSADESNRQAREQMPRNVVIDIHDAGFWRGHKTVWSVQPPRENGGDAFIVIAQDRKSGAIVAAGEYTFEKTGETAQN